MQLRKCMRCGKPYWPEAIHSCAVEDEVRYTERFEASIENPAEIARMWAGIENLLTRYSQQA